MLKSLIFVISFTLASADDSCARLKKEGLHCDACIQNISAYKGYDVSNCSVRTAEDDYEEEMAALFGKKKPKKLFRKSAFLFKDDNVTTVRMFLTREQWMSMVNKPADEAYFPGRVQIGDSAIISNVALRFKGYIGSLRNCLGRSKCKKLSYKISFDQYNETQSFHGLKKLQLHASLADRTLLRERLVYSLFREMGVAAPRQSYSDVFMHLPGEQPIHLGLHLLTEVIDGRFTESFFKGGNGNLYKEAWPGMSEALIRDSMATNKKEGNISRWNDFSNALNTAENDYELAYAVMDHMHTKQFARYLAVDRAVENVDGPIHFRHTGARKSNTDFENQFWTHNHFVYEDDPKTVDEEDGEVRQFEVVAWDMDLTFPLDSNFNEDSSAGPRPDWDAPICFPGSTNAKCTSCNVLYPTTARSSYSIAPSCFPMFRAMAHGLRTYTMNAAKELINGPLQPCRIRAKLKRWADVIKPYILAEQEEQLWPSIGLQAVLPNQYETELRMLNEQIIPFWLERYHNTLSCDRAAVTEPWSPTINHPKITFLPKLPGDQFGSVGWISGEPANMKDDPETFGSCIMKRCPPFLHCCAEGTKCGSLITRREWATSPLWVKSNMQQETCWPEAINCACSRCATAMKQQWRVSDQVCRLYPKPVIPKAPEVEGLCSSCYNGPTALECSSKLGQECAKGHGGYLSYCNTCQNKGFTKSCLNLMSSFLKACPAPPPTLPTPPPTLPTPPPTLPTPPPTIQIVDWYTKCDDVGDVFAFCAERPRNKVFRCLVDAYKEDALELPCRKAILQRSRQAKEAKERQQEAKKRLEEAKVKIDWFSICTDDRARLCPNDERAEAFHCLAKSYDKPATASVSLLSPDCEQALVQRSQQALSEGSSGSVLPTPTPAPTIPPTFYQRPPTWQPVSTSTSSRFTNSRLPSTSVGAENRLGMTMRGRVGGVGMNRGPMRWGG